MIDIDFVVDEAAVAAAVVVVVEEDMDDDRPNSYFVREDAGSVVPESFEPAG